MNAGLEYRREVGPEMKFTSWKQREPMRLPGGSMWNWRGEPGITRDNASTSGK